MSFLSSLDSMAEGGTICSRVLEIDNYQTGGEVGHNMREIPEKPNHRKTGGKL